MPKRDRWMVNAIKDPPNIRRDREGMVIGMYTRLSLIRRTIEGERREREGDDNEWSVSPTWDSWDKWGHRHIARGPQRPHYE